MKVLLVPAEEQARHDSTVVFSLSCALTHITQSLLPVLPIKPLPALFHTKPQEFLQVTILLRRMFFKASGPRTLVPRATEPVRPGVGLDGGRLAPEQTP